MRIQLPDKVYRLVKAVEKVGGTAYLAGGCVRDHLLNIPSKDIDIEIHNVEPDVLTSILKLIPPTKAVGKSFGIWKLLKQSSTDIEVDISLPTLEGTPVPNLGVKEACRRRDLTINSLLINLHSHEIVDPFNGVGDLEKKILRETDPISFIEDPLRVFRVGQFAARLHCSPTSSLKILCRELTQTSSFANLATERVLMEFEKGWMKSTHPEIAFKIWWDIGALQAYLPYLETLHVDDEKQILCLNALGRGSRYRTSNIGHSMAIMWGILLQLSSKEQTIDLMNHLSINKYLGFPIRKAVIASHSQSKILAKTITSVVQNQAVEEFNLEFLCAVSDSWFPSGTSMSNLDQARERGILTSPLPPLIQGADLLKMGVRGVKIGEYMHRVRTDQLKEYINTREEALALLTTLLENDTCGG